MARRRKTKHSLLSIIPIIQLLITLIFGIATIHMIVLLYLENNTLLLPTALGFLAQLVVLVSSLVPQIVLWLRKKLHSQDGEIYPTLFATISLESTLIIPQYSRLFGIYILDTYALLLIIRFSLLATAAVFLFSALRFYGFSSSRMQIYTSLVLGAALLLCVLAPINIGREDLSIFSSPYDAYLQLAIVLLYLATIATMIMAIIKDRTAVNIKRCISFMLLIVGVYLIISDILIAKLIAAAIYTAGIALLVSSTRESM